MRNKGYELLICLINEDDLNERNDIQSILFRTKRQAKRFFRKLDFECERQVEVYINYHDLKNDWHYEVERLL